jgi:phosphoenolpyruvate carboxylase
MNFDNPAPSTDALGTWCLERLATHSEAARHDPMATSVRSLAIDLHEHLDDGSVDLPSLRKMVKRISDHALFDRAKRLGEQAPDGTLAETVETALAPLKGKSFEEIKSALESPQAGIVFTAHPTFAMSRKLRRALASIASENATESALAGLPHAPDSTVTLWDEHEDAHATILNAQDALRELAATILDWLEAHVDGPWWTILPAPLRLATWVGYDLDGRTDIHWAQTIGIRLDEKSVQLHRYADTLSAIGGEDTADLAAVLHGAGHEAKAQAELFSGDLENPDRIVAAANRLTAIGPHRLTSIHPVIKTLSEIIAAELEPARKKALCVVAAEMSAMGLGLAEIHLRVNAAQVRSAVQSDLGLSGLSEFHDRRALAAAAEKAISAKGQKVNFGMIFQEQMTARRQLMLCSQILKHVDSDTPVRFLIAEIEAPATIMGTIYLARLYGIEHKLDISPLFETPNVIERGGRFMERLLDEPGYVAYIRDRGRLSVQFGFSDSGRFMGQIGANLAIERLHIQLARALAEREIRDIEVVLFNTHGESMGRGGYPGSLIERFDHLVTPWARARYAHEHLKMLPEMSFQGGDGYLHFGTANLAAGTIRGITAWAFAPPTRDIKDAFYADIDFSWDIYRAVKSWQEGLFDDPHYREVLSGFPPNLLPNTGSRKARRQSGTSKDDVSRSLRAIPHNASLQQIAAPANVSGGLGSAAAREPERFVANMNGSQRLERLVRLALRARRLTSMSVLRTYADLFSPSFWTIQAARTDDDKAAKVAYRIADRLHERALDHAIHRLANLLSRDRRQLDAVFHDTTTTGVGDETFDAELYVLHATRLVLIMEGFSLTASTPVFSHRHEMTHESLIDLALDLRFSEVADVIEQIYPSSRTTPFAFAALEEPREAEANQAGYPEIKANIADPLREIDAAIKEITVGISHFYGAFG